MTESNRYMTFSPGSEPGEYASGAVNGEDAMALAEKHLRMKKIPHGLGVTNKFPWWRSIHQTFDPTANTQRAFLERTDIQNNFANLSDKTVYIEEVRIQLIPPAWDYLPHQIYTWVRMGIPPRRQIFEDWVPWSLINTESDRLFYDTELDNYAIKLPAPYFLQRAHLFRVDVEYDSDVFGELNYNNYGFMLGLHGYGQRDHEPIDIMKVVKGWDRYDPQTYDYQSIIFDDDKDRPLRDAWITHISLGAINSDDTDAALQGIMIRPIAPEGPLWHHNEFFRIDQLSEQIGSAYDARDYAIHRPKVPYRLEPGEKFQIEMFNMAYGDYAEYSVTAKVTLIGTQEV